MEEGRGDPERFVEVLGDVVEASNGQIGIHLDRSVVGAEVCGQLGGGCALVVESSLLAEADGEGANRLGTACLAADAVHQRDHQARVDAA